MKLAIIADVHDNLSNLHTFLSWSKDNDIEAIVCCGDLTNQETLSVLSSGFKGDIFMILGNMEIFESSEATKYKNVDLKGRVGVWSIGGKKIGACHEPFLIAKVLEQGVCDIIFYGHTHKPWEEEQDGVKTVNPGTLGGVFSEASFAVYDTQSGKLNLKLVNRL